MKKILLIIPYFGKFNNYFTLFLNSVRYNPTINFLIFTDDTTSYSYPDNVRVVYTSFYEIRREFEKCLGFNVALDTPYKLCDFKPAYGYVFSKYLDGYDFWGYCDTDIIFGNIRSFITDYMLSNYYKILSRGHFSLWKNCQRMNEFFMTSTEGSYQTVFKSKLNFSFDEWGARGVSNYLKKKLPENLFWDEIPFDDISTVNGNFVSAQLGTEGQSNWIYSYNKGNLQRISMKSSCETAQICRKPVLYVHLQKRRMTFGSVVSADNFIIAPPHYFLSDQTIDIDSLRLLGRKIWIYPQYYTIRYHNLLRKMRNLFYK